MASQQEGSPSHSSGGWTSASLPDYEDTGSPQTPFIGQLGRPTFAASYRPTPSNVIASPSTQHDDEVQFDPELYISNEEMVRSEEDFHSFMSCQPVDIPNDFNPVTDEPVAAQTPFFNDAMVALADQLIPDSAFDLPPDLYLPEMTQSNPMLNSVEAPKFGEGFDSDDLGQDWNKYVDFGDSAFDNVQQQQQQQQPEPVQFQPYVAPSDIVLNPDDEYLRPLVDYMVSETGQVVQSLGDPQPAAVVPPVSSAHDLPSLDFTYCPVVDDGFLEGYEHVDVDAEDAAAAAAAAAAALAAVAAGPDAGAAAGNVAGVVTGANVYATWSPAAAGANEVEISDEYDDDDDPACSSATRRKRRWRKSAANRARERHNDKMRMRRRREQQAQDRQVQVDSLSQPANRLPVTRSVAVREEQSNRIERPPDSSQSHVRFNVPSACIVDDSNDEDTITVVHQRPAAAIRTQPSPLVQAQPTRNDYTTAPAVNTFVPGTYRVVGDGNVIGYFREFSLEEARQYAGHMMIGGHPMTAPAPTASTLAPWTANPQYPGGAQYPVGAQYPGGTQYPVGPQYPGGAQYPVAVNMPVTFATGTTITSAPFTSASASGTQPRRSGRVRNLNYPRRD